LARVTDRLTAPARAAGPPLSRLAAAVDPSFLAVFRVAFATIVTWEVWRAFDGNLIRADYDLPTFHFRWWLFDWVRPLPGVWIYVAFGLLGVAALLVAVGAFYRAAAVVQFLGLAYWFLLDKSGYLNHRYLATILAFLLIFVPAHAAWSVDALRGKGHRVVGRWALWLLRFQVGVPYFFAGIAKLNYDWLVRNEPLRIWFAQKTDFPLIGPLLDQPGFVRMLAYGSAALDLFVPFLLLHRRTRTYAYGAAVLFHLMNSRLFDIGIFPWMMIAATTVFFEPDWPRRLVRALRGGPMRLRAGTVAGGVVGFLVGALLPPSFVPLQACMGAFGVAVFAFHLLEARTDDVPAVRETGSALRPLAVACLALWVAVQLLAPLRHFVYPGNVHWTEEGQRFSWHMLLNTKSVLVEFRVTEPATGRMWIEPMHRHLSGYQIRKLKSPDMILTFAHQIERFYREQGLEDVEVRAVTRASLNGRGSQRMIDPRVDLTEVRRPYLPTADWIRPLRE
jgi:vitamin K-dependent gamma-carboxylase